MQLDEAVSPLRRRQTTEEEANAKRQLLTKLAWITFSDHTMVVWSSFTSRGQSFVASDPFGKCSMQLVSSPQSDESGNMKLRVNGTQCLLKVSSSLLGHEMSWNTEEKSKRLDLLSSTHDVTERLILLEQDAQHRWTNSSQSKWEAEPKHVFLLAQLPTI